MKRGKVREITCIVCPVGCRASVTIRNREVRVDNVECPRGEAYILKELQEPKRDFFTTIRVRGASFPVCPVRATQPIAKEKILDCAKELAKTVKDAPIKAGEKIVEDLMGLGVDIVATRDLNRVEGKQEEQRALPTDVEVKPKAKPMAYFDTSVPVS